MDEFKQLGLSNNTIKALEKKGFTKPTSIQSKAIPLLLEGKKDIVAQSQTGTGKTASFALPILEKIKEHSKTVQAIILTPTRELALQVAEEINSLKGDKHVKILPVYGGSPIGPQREKLRTGIDIVVGTPGRVMDLQKRKSLKIDDVQYVVLDEADEMLNMGFVDDIESILQSTPKDKTMLLFSATIPKQILKIAQKYMREYELIEVEKTQVITENVEQIYYDVDARDRVEAIRRIIDYYFDFYGIIFCNTKATVDTLAHQLTSLNYKAVAIHGDITQSQREKILQQFKNKSIKILIATDVAARGIDVNDLTHVINFSLPQSPELYVHRIGRTGRAGKKGISVTLVIPSERRKLGFVERINKCKLTKQKLPSIKQIIDHKEAQIKKIIANIIEANAGKSSKYNLMAEELLKEHNPSEVIAAVLKYSFKSDLDVNSYKEIQESNPSSDFSGSRSRSKFAGSRSGFRGGRDSARRDKRRSNDQGRSNSKFERKSPHQDTNRKFESFSKYKFERQSENKNSERKHSERKSKRFEKPHFKRNSNKK